MQVLGFLVRWIKGSRGYGDSPCIRLDGLYATSCHLMAPSLERECRGNISSIVYVD